MAARRDRPRGTPAPARWTAQPRWRRAAVAAWAALVVVAVLAVVFIWPGRSQANLRPIAGQNVLLITIDTLRADALGSYGGPAATPALDRLAADGVRFEFAHAHAVMTLPSHASILTGQYPFQHGVRDNSGYRLPRDARTAATLFKQAGYATAAFVGAFPVHARFGLNVGFDVYDDRFGDALAASEFAMPERPASAVVPLARQWIAARTGGTAGAAGRQDPWFVWVHVFDPHAPYRPPAPFDSQGLPDSDHTACVRPPRPSSQNGTQVSATNCTAMPVFFGATVNGSSGPLAIFASTPAVCSRSSASSASVCCCTDATLSAARFTSSASFIDRPTPRAAVVARPTEAMLTALRPMNAPSSVAPNEIAVCSFADDAWLASRSSAACARRRRSWRIAIFGAYCCRRRSTASSRDSRAACCSRTRNWPSVSPG